LDLVFVLDSSASLSQTDLDTAKTFVRDVVDQFEIGSDKVQVAVVEYSTAVAASFFLNKYNSKAEVQKAVDGIRYNPGGTNTADALNYTVQNVFSERNGARKGAARVRTIIRWSLFTLSILQSDTVLESFNVYVRRFVAAKY